MNLSVPPAGEWTPAPKPPTSPAYTGAHVMFWMVAALPVIAALAWVGSLITVLGTTPTTEAMGPTSPSPVTWAIAAWLLIGLLGPVIAFAGVAKARPWGRVAALVFGVVEWILAYIYVNRDATFPFPLLYIGAVLTLIMIVLFFLPSSTAYLKAMQQYRAAAA